MTREEAKRRLLDIERCTPIHTREDARDFEALEMAIQALSQEPCDDAISREDALNSLIENTDFEGWELSQALEAIEKLPSVTQNPKYWIDKDSKIYKLPADIPTMTIQYPTAHGDTISRTEVMNVLSDFIALEKYIDKHNHITFEPLEQMINSLPSVTQKSIVCDDAISRDAVDKYIARLLSGYLYDGERERLEIFSAYLWELPSVTQKYGKWITTRTFMHDGEYYCDRCKCDAPNNEKWDYCPNCGAKMQESEVRNETDN